MTATLYVIRGSHACRSAMLALEHKGISYDVVCLPAGLHPVLLPLLGFSPDHRPFREVDGRRRRLIGLADRLGTVPALRIGDRRVRTSRDIVRHLESVQPEPPAFPADAGRRARVVDAERWGDVSLQMTARRVVLAAGTRGALVAHGDDGPLGPLLCRRRTTRRVVARTFSVLFAATPRREPQLLAEARRSLDRVDALIAEGVLAGAAPNAADFMIAPSVALLAYHPNLAREISRRPAGRLVALAR